MSAFAWLRRRLPSSPPDASAPVCRAAGGLVPVHRLRRALLPALLCLALAGLAPGAAAQTYEYPLSGLSFTEQFSVTDENAGTVEVGFTLSPAPSRPIAVEFRFPHLETTVGEETLTVPRRTYINIFGVRATASAGGPSRQVLSSTHVNSPVNNYDHVLVTIPAGSTQGTLHIPLFDNSLYHENRLVQIIMFHRDMRAEGSKSQTDMIIRDDESDRGYAGHEVRGTYVCESSGPANNMRTTVPGTPVQWGNQQVFPLPKDIRVDWDHPGTYGVGDTATVRLSTMGERSCTNFGVAVKVFSRTQARVDSGRQGRTAPGPDHPVAPGDAGNHQLYVPRGATEASFSVPLQATGEVGFMVLAGPAGLKDGDGNSLPRYVHVTRPVAETRSNSEESITVPPGQLPVLTLTSATADPVTEGEQVSFTITADRPPVQNLLVNVFYDQTMGDGQDRVVSSGWKKVGLRAGETSAVWSFAAYSDAVALADGTIAVNIEPDWSDPPGYTVGTPSDATLTLLDDDGWVAPPEVNILASAGGTEGTDATFTITANPPPAAPLPVDVSIAASGDFGITPGTQTVTIPTTGSYTLTLPTTDDGTDEPDGSVTLTVEAGDGYTVGSAFSETVVILDDDAAAATAAVDPALVAKVRGYIAETGRSAEHVKRWKRVLKAFGETDADLAGLTPMTAAEAQGYADRKWTRWDEIVTALAALEDGAPEPPAVPEVTIVADAASATEGTAASFTLTADPPPAAPLAVTVSVAATGDYGVTTETRTVTIPTSGSYTLTVATTDDATDEPDGSVTASVAAGDGYTVGAAYAGTVAVLDDDAAPATVPAVSIVADASSATEGADASFTLTATPPPAAPLAVTVNVAATGDFGVTAGSRTVTIPATGSFTLTVPTADDALDEPDGSVTATVEAGNGYAVGAQASGTVAIEDDDLPPPVVSIAADAASVTEGGNAAFTVSADRAPDADLAVALAVSEAKGSDFVAAEHEGTATVVIPKGQTEAAFKVPTVNDTVDEPDGSVTVALAAGDGYTPGAAASATVSVADNDAAGVPTLSIEDATAREGQPMRFALRLSAPLRKLIVVRVYSRESTPVSARAGVDYRESGHDVEFRPGQTVKYVAFPTIDDSHDDGGETFEAYIHTHIRKHPRTQVEIGDGVAVGTIENSDPLPAAWLARFGRTVAEQALEGISGRMAAPRAPGMQGTLAGQALSFDPAASGQAGAGAESGTTPTDRDAVLAMADIARGFDNGNGGGAGHGTDPFGHGGGALGDHRAGFGETQAQSRTMTAREALLGSSFSLTAQRDGAGGSMAFWGRASQGSFDGKERGDGTDISLDGEVTTGMLGADYARGKWLVGLALTQSSAEGRYAALSDEGVDPCPDTDAVLCDGAVRAGDGTVEASLTAAIPYGAWQASERLKLWGAAGYGTGEVTLKTDPGSESGAGGAGQTLSADTTWLMAAAGMRGDLLEAPKEGSGPALALTSDALWARTRSDKTRDLRATESDVTRLRLGLEGSWHVALGSGGSLVPKLEVGARHDGGDAETGFGVELGGGVRWSDPALGLSLDLSGRTLLAHEDGDLKDRGYAASLAFDPAPATQRGPSLSLRQAFGGQASGGLDALFNAAPLEDRTGSEATSRWAMEAAYGFPVFGGRFTGSPHLDLGLATGARDYSLGWRLTPEAASAPNLSFGLKAVRRESDATEPEHTVGVEIRARW